MSEESLSHFLSGAKGRRWFSLEELVQAVLEHLTSADAAFQMRQRETWKKIAAAFTPLDRLEQLGGLEFVAGLDRFENLGLSEFEIQICVRRRRFARFRRAVRRIFGDAGQPEEEEYRLKNSGRWGGGIQVRVAARRSPAGSWHIDSSRVKGSAESS